MSRHRRDPFAIEPGRYPPRTLQSAVDAMDEAQVRAILEAGQYDMNLHHESLVWVSGADSSDPTKVVSIAALLIAHGADVNATNFLGMSPLHKACGCGGCDALVELLLANGAAVDARDCLQATPLRLAASSGRTSFARLLLANGASVDAISAGGTPLLFASLRGHSDTALLLIEHGADVNAVMQPRIHRISTSLGNAARLGDMDFCRRLILHGAVSV